MASNFAHLHVHTDYSALDGAAHVDALVAEVVRLEQPAIAVTDHGTMSGTYALYKAAKDAGVTPILGLEAYLSPGLKPREDHSPTFFGEVDAKGKPTNPGDDCSGAGAYTHLTLLAATQDGLRNMFQMTAGAAESGIYRKPRLDLDLLSTHGSGIIATTGCPSGEIQTLLRLGQTKRAYEYASTLRDIFDPGNLYVELMDHGLDIETRVKADLLKMAKELNLPLVATNDLHYVTQPEHRWHEAMLAVQSGAKLTDPKERVEGQRGRFAFDGDTYYVRTAAEMRSLFSGDLEVACDNTLLIAEQVKAGNVTFGGAPLMPKFPVPEGTTEAEEFRRLAREGLAARFGGEHVRGDYWSRLEYEMDIIEDMGFPGYFLVVADFVQWAKDNGIAVGPGRGSVGGALVAWALRITEVDPIRHDLLFERFLNPERVSLPDIDLDFDDQRRHEVIEYVRQKYGDDKVAHIATNMVSQAKVSLRDAARVLGHEYSVGDALSKAYPNPVMGKGLAFADSENPDHPRYVEAEEFRNLVASSKQNQVIYSLAKRFEGTLRGYGMHAAGVLVSPEPIANHVPMMRKDKNSPMMTGFDYPTCESLGLVKMDFLGLSNLGTIDRCVEMVRANTGETINIQHLIDTLDDEATYGLLRRGETVGVFQLESPPMRALLRRMQPDGFEDISAVLALYRPGPMGANAHNDYADRKNKRQVIKPIHPEFKESLNEVLGSTYGVICFQEQVMRIAQVVAGYSLAQADNLRRAMGKKKKEVLDKEFVPFRDGAKSNGYSDAAIQALWDVLVPFADYAFNASHSAAYGITSYITAYLKANHPAEYMAALLATTQGKVDKTTVALNEARAMGIPVMVPDVNESGADYWAANGRIRVGFVGVKGVGEGPAEAIIREREEKGPYSSFSDFLDRHNGSPAGNKRVVKSLIEAGAFDSLGQHRAMLSASLEGAMAAMTKSRTKARAQAKKAGSVFSRSLVESVPLPVVEVQPWRKGELLAVEREVLGRYVSGHPLDGFEAAVASASTHSALDVLTADEDWVTTEVTVVGIVTGVEHKVSKASGKPWCLVTLEDHTAAIEVPVFSHRYPVLSSVFVIGEAVSMKGKARWDHEDGKLFFAAQDASKESLSSLQRKHAARVSRSGAGVVGPNS